MIFTEYILPLLVIIGAFALLLIPLLKETKRQKQYDRWRETEVQAIQDSVECLQSIQRDLSRIEGECRQNSIFLSKIINKEN